LFLGPVLSTELISVSLGNKWTDIKVLFQGGKSLGKSNFPELKGQNTVYGTLQIIIEGLWAKMSN